MATARRTLEEYLASVASREPVPGGGAVAAVAAALGAALGSMVLAYSTGRPGQGEESDAVIAAVQGSLEELRGHLLHLADEDSSAYAAVRQARDLPKDTPAEKTHRQEQVQQALLRAAEVPLKTGNLCREALECLEGLADRVNPHLLSDLGGAALLLRAAAEGAALNVRVNLRSLKDAEQRGRLGTRLEAILGRCQRLAGNLLDHPEAPRD